MKKTLSFLYYIVIAATLASCNLFIDDDLGDAPDGEEHWENVPVHSGEGYDAPVTITQAAFKADPISATAMQVASQMYPGWNLGNTLEPPVAGLAAETSWQPTKTTQQVIDYVRSLGFRSVRIPCSWNCHMTNGQIDPQWTARVREVVDYCINDGLYVVLNDHWDNGWIETNGFTDLSESNVSAKLDALKNMWTQIATAFSAYESAFRNEAPTDLAQADMLACMTRIRELLVARYSQGVLRAAR